MTAVRSTPRIHTAAPPPRYEPAPSLVEIQAGKRTASRGMQGEAVRWLQAQLNRQLPAGSRLPEDGKWGPKTQAAFDAFRRQGGLSGAGLDRSAFDKLKPQGGAAPATQVEPSATPSQGANGTARFTGTEGVGQRNQLKSGKITVNGRTYDFVSGGHGRGNLPPGEYKVEPWSPSGPTMYKDGVGFSYRLLKKQDGKWVDSGIRDSRLGVRDRGYFRIHPDGGSRGTEGCIGIRGNGATQRRFKQDLEAELARARRDGRPFTITVG